MRNVLARLLGLLLLLAPAPLLAQPAAPVTTTSPATAPTPASADSRCLGDPPSAVPPGNARVTVSWTAFSPGAAGTWRPDASTAIWQPRGGEVLFTLTSLDGTAPSLRDVLVCFRLRGAMQGWTTAFGPLRTVQIGPNAITYGARVPDLPPAAENWFRRVVGGAQAGEYAGLWIVPIADFRVLGDAGGARLDAMLPLGITSLSFSTLVSVAGVVLALAVLYGFGRRRAVPGSDVVLTLISTRDGHASLSQLQMLVWTFVVGWGGAYVMALKGDLIEVSMGTLILLGISGVAALATKAKEAGVIGAAPPPPPPPPGQAAPRFPAWSDLVVTDNGPATIDMTRLQMLFFTAIGAVFVTLKILTSQHIPEFPDNFLLLMGISNGVYLTAKFIP